MMLADGPYHIRVDGALDRSMTFANNPGVR
jgi:hypothetical protein